MYQPLTPQWLMRIADMRGYPITVFYLSVSLPEIGLTFRYLSIVSWPHRQGLSRLLSLGKTAIEGGLL
jgi:hypothetical protein